jgi:Putative restriction endonuclease
VTVQPREEEPVAMTEANYLAFEEQPLEKHEFVDGWVYPLHGVAGITMGHNRLQMSVLDVLRPAAREQGCEALDSDLRVRFRSQERLRYYYPDALRGLWR